MLKHDKELARQIKAMRDKVEADAKAMIDAHMAEHYADRAPFWAAAMRASIEVATWPAWKRRRCYSQD